MDNDPKVLATPTVEEPKTPQEPVTPEVVTPAPAPQVKGIPYEQYHEKIKEIKRLEEELETLKTSTFSEQEIYSDEGKVLKSKIETLESELAEVKGQQAKDKLVSSNPILKEKWQEFEDFRQLPENKGMNLNTAAKAFLIENGLLEPARKGVEKPTGGLKLAPTFGMSVEDVKTLRETNFKKYQDMLMKGQIKIE